MATVDDDASLLVIVLDVNRRSWAGEPAGLPFPAFLDHLIVLANAFAMLNRRNRLVVLGANASRSFYLYPPEDEQARRAPMPHVSQLTGSVAAQLRGALAVGMEDEEAGADEDEKTLLGGALSLALCHINKASRTFPDVKARLLVVQAAPDHSPDYIAIMNCIFSAQKLNVPVDAVILARDDSVLLQQAAHLTSGVYLKPEAGSNLSQIMLSSFIVDSHSRTSMDLPTLTDVDYRGTCFCHRKVVDVGHVCSVCLSVFCSFSPICSTCGARFKLRRLAPPPARRVAKAAQS